MHKAPVAVDKKLVHFTSFEEMSSRPRFVDLVDPKQVQLEDAIGVYHLPHSSHVPCGLSDCRTKHGLGLLMVTADGLETNIGNRCGFKKFGVQYQRIKNAAIASDRRERNREKIRTALAERDQFHSTIEALLSAPHGAKWLAKVKADFERRVPSEACYMIRKMAREGTPSVYTARLRTGKEMELQRELHGSGRTHVSRYALDQVGTLAGLDFWIHDLRGLLIDQLQMKMRALEGEAVPSLTEVRLRQYAGWLDEVPFKITEAQRLIGEGAKFFNPANLNLIKYLSTDERKIEGLATAIDAVLPLVR